jgi:hypothetical protein
LRINAREGTFPLSPSGRRRLEEEDIAVSDSGIELGAGWHPVEGQPEQPFRWVTDDAEMWVMPPRTAEAMWLDVEPGPGVGGASFELLIENPRTQQRVQVTVPQRCWIALRFPFEAGRSQAFRLRALSQAQRMRGSALDPRVLAFRVFSFSWGGAGSEPRATPPQKKPNDSGEDVFTAETGVATLTLYQKLRNLIRRFRTADKPFRVSIPAPVGWLRRYRFRLEHGGFSFLIPRGPKRDAGLARAPSSGSHRPEADVKEPIAPEGKPVPPATFTQPLHTNACGDFTLLGRGHWLELRGYPEFDTFSMNLDSVFCLAAHFGGAPEEVLDDRMRIYHIEHGSGYSPQGEKELYARIRDKGIEWFSYHEYLGWAEQMHRLDCTMVFNLEDWGLANEEFPERVFSSSLARDL